MTTYILHGGATNINTVSNRKFFLVIKRNLPRKGTILCIYFAKKEDTWPELAKQDTVNFTGGKNKKFNIVIADNKIRILTQQIRQADVIYIRGGDTNSLKRKLKKLTNLSQLLKAKTIAASSAGVYALSMYYYSNSKNRICKGLGVLSIKSFCHYTEEKLNKLNRLKKYKENMRTYAIPEGKYAIINQ